jgi:hypothetical protein
MVANANGMHAGLPDPRRRFALSKAELLGNVN